jgi:alcohol dehydrogenase class IV
MDALTQLIEPYLSSKANPLTDAICAEGIRRAARALPRVWDNPNDRDARRDMSLASLLSGMALANAGLGAVHGFAAPIGGMFSAPHGGVCAALLPHVMAVNLRAAPATGRFHEVARLTTGNPHASAADAVTWIADLCRKLEIPGLGMYGITVRDAPELAAKAAQASSMKGNPVMLSSEDLQEIIVRAL